MRRATLRQKLGRHDRGGRGGFRFAGEQQAALEIGGPERGVESADVRPLTLTREKPRIGNRGRSDRRRRRNFHGERRGRRQLRDDRRLQHVRKRGRRRQRRNDDGGFFRQGTQHGQRAEREQRQGA